MQKFIVQDVPNQIVWTLRSNNIDPYWLGFIPEWLNEADERKASEQLNEHYQHGGGWRPFGIGKYELLEGGDIQYPGDPVSKWMIEGKFRDETIRVFPHEFIGIFQEDGSFEICRMD